MALLHIFADLYVWLHRRQLALCSVCSDTLCRSKYMKEIGKRAFSHNYRFYSSIPKLDRLWFLKGRT